MNGARIGSILVFAASINRIIDTMIGKNADQLLDIGEVRHVFKRQRIVGEEGGDHQRKRSIFRARDRNNAVELVAADDFDAIHAVSPSGPKPLPGNRFLQIPQRSSMQRCIMKWLFLRQNYVDHESYPDRNAIKNWTALLTQVLPIFKEGFAAIVSA